MIKNYIQDLLCEIINTEFSYRDILDLPSELTFGLEIEYENVDEQLVKNYLKDNGLNWNYKSEDSLLNGGEIVSPILVNNKQSWIELKKICLYLKEQMAITNVNAGAHVHIGANIIGDNYLKWVEFVKLYMYYENIIYRYSYGEELYARKDIKKYAEPIAPRLYDEFYLFEKATSLQTFSKKVPKSRFFSLNFCNIKFDNISENKNKNTIEFRSPNGTINEKIWQNNVNTFAKMILAVMNNKVDIEYIDYEIKQEESCFNKDFYYNEIYLKKAIEFANTIFDNNIDKLMFLKQYIKDLNSVCDKYFVKK